MVKSRYKLLNWNGAKTNLNRDFPRLSLSHENKIMTGQLCVNQLNRTWTFVLNSQQQLQYSSTHPPTSLPLPWMGSWTVREFISTLWCESGNYEFLIFTFDFQLLSFLSLRSRAERSKQIYVSPTSRDTQNSWNQERKRKSLANQSFHLNQALLELVMLTQQWNQDSTRWTKTQTMPEINPRWYLCGKIVQ